MKFLLAIHRSIVDPSFYQEVRALRARVVWGYVSVLLLLGALLGGTATTVRFVNAESGFPAFLGRALGGSEIRDGLLHPSQKAPYLPSRSSVAEAVESFLGVPDVGALLPDSFLVVDTGGAIGAGERSTVVVLLGRAAMQVNLGPGLVVSVPYTRLVGSSGVFVFDAAFIHRFLVRRAPAVWLHFALQNLLVSVLNMLLSVSFLSVAAFILRLRVEQRFSVALKIAAFAYTPAAIGYVLEVVSGTRLQWTWYAFMLVSFVVMSRGIRSCLVADNAGRSDT